MSLIDVFVLLDDPDMQVPGGLVLTRTGTTGVQDSLGRFASTAPLSIPMNPAMVHNAKWRDLQQLPEADRSIETIKVYGRVRPFCDSGLQDTTVYNGRTWKIVAVKDYEIQGGGYISLAQLKESVAA